MEGDGGYEEGVGGAVRGRVGQFEDCNAFYCLYLYILGIT